ncbi:MAG: bifunctional 3-deoxy-7-phosphoheptulonate synthase/chorismate mutase type II [Bacteroidales bacterium]|nr:bifunctional 3-deoxy-7-phosphoheptulonate synthase/chorismate mutase type II [Bacteroidales bacterium]
MGVFPNIIPINEWFSQFKSQSIIISGPCSAESEEQILSTAKEIDKIGKVTIFRAGIWKPRTRPESFEGIGEKGLIWLKRVKEETKLLTITEVATPEHIELCLKNNIDLLWIGARTTSNPFSVQELANALKGVDIPVMVKNPVNPDINLWTGALERISMAGIKKIAAIHRGFFPFEQTPLRNIPKWEIPIELKRKFNNIPVICDPSHISGTTVFIEEIAQRALDLNMDGLMIESHIDPKNALSDTNQQLTPAELDNLLNKLIFRKASSNNKEFVNTLEQYRNQIDSIDAQMLELFAQRMAVIEKIGEYKKKNNVTIFQLKRWENIFSTRNKLGKKLGLSDDFVKKLLQIIHKESIQKQTEVMKKKTLKH